MTTPDAGTDTAHSVSPDSGTHWTEPGAWPVAPGIHRIPLPLPLDGLRAINVYVIETEDGSEVIIPGLPFDAAILPDPPRVRRPEDDQDDPRDDSASDNDGEHDSHASHHPNTSASES